MGLQALALNENEPEEFDDLLEPNYEELQRFEPILSKFKQTFFDGLRMDPQCDENNKKGR